jgi:hypothetical protein
MDSQDYLEVTAFNANFILHKQLSTKHRQLTVSIFWGKTYVGISRQMQNCSKFYHILKEYSGMKWSQNNNL